MNVVNRAAAALLACALSCQLTAAAIAAGVPLESRAGLIDDEDTTLDDPRQLVVPGGYDRSGEVVVLTGGLVFDSTGAPARRASVLIEGKRIARILPAGSADWPPNARVVEVAGKWVMPGLIDLHVHLTAAEPGLPPDLVNDPADATLRGVERLRVYLLSGITTVRDVASHGTVPFRLRRWVVDGRISGPRIYAAGQLITGTGGHGAETAGVLTAPAFSDAVVREASGADDWRNAVREQFKRGADLIKLGSHFSPDEIAAATDEAHRLGLRVTVDAETLYVDMAVRAGVDCIEHPLPRAQQTIALMARNHVCAVPTLVPYDIIIDLGGYYGSSSRRFSIRKDLHRSMLRSLLDAGVQVGVGTDLVSDWFRFLPTPYIQELKSLAAAGYTAEESLMAATRGGAQILGMGDRLGTLEPGKLADVVVIDGRPDGNLDDLARVDMVLRDGRVVVRGGRLSTEPHSPRPMPVNDPTRPLRGPRLQ